MADPVAPEAARAGLEDRLQTLRQAGAAQVDPVRLHFLEVLARGIAAVPVAQQNLLQPRWDAAFDALQRACETAGPLQARREPAPTPGLAALAALNRHARAASGQVRGTEVLPPDDADAGELRSLRAFRDSWSRIAAVDTVDAAVAHGPDNAGPLNSHRLVLRSLALMRALSPEYLRRFLSQVQTLQRLETVASGPADPAAARTRPKAPRKRR